MTCVLLRMAGVKNAAGPPCLPDRIGYIYPQGIKICHHHR